MFSGGVDVASDVAPVLGGVLAGEATGDLLLGGGGAAPSRRTDGAAGTRVSANLMPPCPAPLTWGQPAQALQADSGGGEAGQTVMSWVRFRFNEKTI